MQFAYFYLLWQEPYKNGWFKGADSFKITFLSFYKGNTTFHRNCLKYRKIYRQQELPITLLPREWHTIPLDPNGMQLPFYIFLKSFSPFAEVLNPQITSLQISFG